MVQKSRRAKEEAAVEVDAPGELLDRLRTSINGESMTTEGVIERLRHSLPQPLPPRGELDHGQLTILLAVEDLDKRFAASQERSKSAMEAAEELYTLAERILPVQSKLTQELGRVKEM